MKVEFKIRKTVNRVIYPAGHIADMPDFLARPLLHQNVVAKYPPDDFPNPFQDPEASPGLSVSSQETTSLPNTRETATRPKPQGKPKPPVAIGA